MICFDPNPEINHDNLHKHGFTLSSAQEVFKDPYAKLDEDYDVFHSTAEDRYHGSGMLPNGKIIVFTYTMRDNDNRLITVREATTEEKKVYNGHVKEILGL